MGNERRRQNNLDHLGMLMIDFLKVNTFGKGPWENSSRESRILKRKFVGPKQWPPKLRGVKSKAESTKL